MNNLILVNVWRFLFLILIQGLVLKQMEFETGAMSFVHPIIYPLCIMMLPMRITLTLSVFLAFVAGLTVDFFYTSPGVHASAAVFIAFVRPWVLNQLEPRGGYTINQNPTAFRLGRTWFLKYVAILLGVYLFFYFSVEAFTFYYLWRILLNTVLSFIVSILFILLYQIFFNPTD